MLTQANRYITRRQALRYIIRNVTLSSRMRAQAQLQLSQMHCYTRSTQIKNRCIEGGKGRGVLSDFRMARVRFISLFLVHPGLLRLRRSIFCNCANLKEIEALTYMWFDYTVLLPNECTRWRLTRSEEGQLVELLQLG